MNPCLFVLAIIQVFGIANGGPQRDLRSDLKSLNVRHTTEHYAISGTVSEEKLSRYGRALEYIFREYARGFSELVKKTASPNNPEKAKALFNVVILATAAEYEEFTKAYFDAHAEHTNGLFVPAVDLLIIRDGPEFEDTYGLLFHEAFHQFAFRHVPVMPPWLNEGMATYYGTARATTKGLVFDRPRSDNAAVVLQAAKKHQLVPLRKLMDFSPAAFYDQAPVPGLSFTRRTLCYAQSYTLTSYMINDPKGRQHLRTFIREISGAASADDVRQITREKFADKLLDAMVEAWLAHAETMR